MKKLKVRENIDATIAPPAWLEYFHYMGKTEIEIASLCLHIKPKNKKEKKFIKEVKKALRLIKSNYWISTIEPTITDEYYTNTDRSFNSTKKLSFEKGSPTDVSLCFCEWEECAKNFASGWDSDLAYWYEWIVFLAYRIAKNYCTLDFVCTHSVDPGKPGIYYMEPSLTAHIKIAGFYDGICNTQKITKNHTNSEYFVYGTPHYNIDRYTIASHRKELPCERDIYAAGVVVLRNSLIHQVSEFTKSR